MASEKTHIITTNKKASFSYILSDSFLCGIQLKGSEIKSIRMKQVNMSDAYCIIDNNEIWVKNLDINQYKFSQEELYESKRRRKLLLKKIEIKKIKRKIEAQGMSLIPVKIIMSEKGLAKIEIAIGKGKKTYDKRASLKEKDVKREISQKKREK